MQTKREEFLKDIQEEMMLRKLIRKGIAIIESKKKNEEYELRSVIRNLIYEAKANKVKVHDTTGMNYLEDLFSNTSFLSDLKRSYTSLKTSVRQRESFKAHILNALEGLLNRDELNRQEDAETKEDSTSLKATPSGDGESNVNINITDQETKKEQESAAQESDKFQMMPGMDESGAASAELIWPSLESNIKNELVKTRDPRDRSVFEKYLIENVVAYFEEWEDAMIGKYV